MVTGSKHPFWWLWGRNNTGCGIVIVRLKWSACSIRWLLVSFLRRVHGVFRWPLKAPRDGMCANVDNDIEKFTPAVRFSGNFVGRVASDWIRAAPEGRRRLKIKDLILAGVVVLNFDLVQCLFPGALLVRSAPELVLVGAILLRHSNTANTDDDDYTHIA